MTASPKSSTVTPHGASKAVIDFASTETEVTNSKLTMSETESPYESSGGDEIPVLTDVIEEESTAEPAIEVNPSANEELIAELQTKLSVGAFTLTEQLLHSAISEMEATLFEQVLNRLRQELPELVDSVLREHLADDSDDE